MRTIKFIIIIIFLNSCQKNISDIHSFSENKWDFNDSVIFYFNITDTILPKDLSFFVRNTVDYEYRNLFLLVETSYKNQTIKMDTLEYLITDKYGQWLGNGSGEMKDNYLIFNESFIFKKSGKYSLTVQHGMRNNPLIGINKLGFKVQ